MRYTWAHPAPTTVLVVEDDPSIRLMLRATLETEGHTVLEAATAAEGARLASDPRVGLIILDLGLPDEDGVTLIRTLREWTRRPIVVVSAGLSQTLKVRALDAGADDYLEKPFGIAELHSRVRAVLRRALPGSNDATATLHLGPIQIDLAARLVLCGTDRIPLTATQWRVLEVLARESGRLVSSERLLNEVWGPLQGKRGHYLRIYIHRLRQLLEPDPSHPCYIINESGLGYRLLSDRQGAR